MDGYYDHGPTVDLDRPVALAGYVTEETRVMGYRLAALLGLPAVDLDRRIEGQTGRSVWSVIWDDTEVRYRQLEREHLRRALGERPCSIVTLGDGTLMDPTNRALVLRESHLVALDLDLPNCYWRLKASSAADLSFWHPLHPGPLQRFEQVRPFWEARAPGFAEAPHHIEMPGKDKGDVVAALQALVERLAASSN